MRAVLVIGVLVGCNAVEPMQPPAPFCGDGHVDPGEQCDDGNPIANDGCTSCMIDPPPGPHIAATWQLKSVVTGSPVGCPATFDTAALIDQTIDAQGNAVGSPIIDLFSCTTGAGTSSGLPPATYRTWVQITDHSGANTYAASVPAIVDVTATDLTYNTDILTDGGYFSLAWSLVGAQSNAPLTCAQAGISGASAGVEMVATVSGGTTSFDAQFPCEDGRGISAGLPAGPYTVSVDAFTSAGAAGTAPALTNRSITGPNNVTDLGTITIPITGQ